MSSSPIDQAYRPPQDDHGEEPARHEERSDLELRNHAARVAGALLLTSAGFDAAAQMITFVLGRQLPWFELMILSGSAWIGWRLWRRGPRWRGAVLLLLGFLTVQALERAYSHLIVDIDNIYAYLRPLVFLAVFKTPPIGFLLLGVPSPRRVRAVIAGFVICQLAVFGLSAVQVWR